MIERFLQCRTELPMLFHNGSHVGGGLGFLKNPGLDEFKKLSRVSSPRVWLKPLPEKSAFFVSPAFVGN